VRRPRQQVHALFVFRGVLLCQPPSRRVFAGVHQTHPVRGQSSGPAGHALLWKELGIASWFRAICVPSSAAPCGRQNLPEGCAWRRSNGRFLDRTGSSRDRHAWQRPYSDRACGTRDCRLERETQDAARAARMRFEQIDEFDRDRHLPLLPALGVEAHVRLGCHPGGLQLKLISVQNRCTTSISRKPVNRKVEKSAFSVS